MINLRHSYLALVSSEVTVNIWEHSGRFQQCLSVFNEGVMSCETFPPSNVPELYWVLTNTPLRLLGRHKPARVNV